jgi:tetratricopeptide (TPR) repeat protein
MFDLKLLSSDAVPTALEKALRYRLLNDPAEAESICHDVLRIDPENQQATVILLLALTDRFGKGYAVGVTQAQEVLSHLHDPYERAYYAGIICERRAKAQLSQGHPGSGHDAYELLREAMTSFEKAESLRPAKNDDALLHWNTCARLIMGNQLTPRVEEKVELSLE